MAYYLPLWWLASSLAVPVGGNLLWWLKDRPWREDPVVAEMKVARFDREITARKLAHLEQLQDPEYRAFCARSDSPQVPEDEYVYIGYKELANECS